MTLAALRNDATIGQKLTLAGPQAFTVSEVITLCERFANADADVTEVPPGTPLSFVTVLAAHIMARFAAKPASMLDLDMYYYCCEAYNRYTWRRRCRCGCSRPRARFCAASSGPGMQPTAWCSPDPSTLFHATGLTHVSMALATQRVKLPPLSASTLCAFSDGYGLFIGRPAL